MGQLPHKLEAVGAKGRAGQFFRLPTTTPWPREALSLNAGSPMLLSSESTLLCFPQEVEPPFTWLLQLVRGWGEQNIYMRYSQMKLESRVFCMSTSSHLMWLFIIIFVIVFDYTLVCVCTHDSMGTFAHVGARSWCQMSLPNTLRFGFHRIQRSLLWWDWPARPRNCTISTFGPGMTAHCFSHT